VRFHYLDAALEAGWVGQVIRVEKDHVLAKRLPRTDIAGHRRATRFGFALNQADARVRPADLPHRLLRPIRRAVIHN